MPDATDDPAYAARLVKLQGARWKRYVPNPYRYFLRHLKLGRTLEVGCGVGRILGYLAPDAVGVDTNSTAVTHCRSLGFEAYSPAELEARNPAPFDSLVLAHVLEHLSRDGAVELLRSYLHYLRPNGRVVIICPQEKGYRSDPTHVQWHDLDALRAMACQLNLEPLQARSYPLPRFAGTWFVYNEFVLVASISGAVPI